MNLYSTQIFPRLLDWSMSGEDLGVLRQQTLAPAQGSILEIGFGTGLNLAYYPAGVTRLTALDPNPGMRRLAQRRIQRSTIQVELTPLQGESLPFPDASFDTVVSTWTLCSIANLSQALQQIHRILTPNGQFLFLEHGLSPDGEVQTWQHRLNPIQKVVGDGCRLDRDIPALIEAQGLGIQTVKRFYVPGIPRWVGYTFQGMATKSTR